MATTMASRLVRHMARRTMTTMATPTENLSQQVTERATAAVNPDLSFLPLRLRNFFAKYPPQHYSAAVAPASRLVPPTDAVSNSHNLTANTSSKEEFDLSSLSPEDLPTPYTPNRDAKGNKRNPTAWSASKAILYNDREHPNPFLPQPSPNGKKWRSPKYGLRQQADLIKMAKKYGVEQLLPTSRKSTIFKETRLAERGLAIKGTGIGQKVKGHKWERTMETRLEERKKAMMEMPELIRQWKQRGHGRGWKKWPRRTA
ncbi:54S ribosomal protein L25 [Talaromyces pinophilus]|nr:54S ribosomal protein L25 [Talaromyces pinophilus]